MNKDFSHTAFIALGSNMNSKFGSPLQTIKAAILQMQQNRKYAEFIKVVKISSFINSKPQNCVTNAADFANAVIKIATIFENPFAFCKMKFISCFIVLFSARFSSLVLLIKKSK